MSPRYLFVISESETTTTKKKNCTDQCNSFGEGATTTITLNRHTSEHTLLLGLHETKTHFAKPPSGLHPTRSSLETSATTNTSLLSQLYNPNTEQRHGKEEGGGGVEGTKMKAAEYFAIWRGKAQKLLNPIITTVTSVN